MLNSRNKLGTRGFGRMPVRIVGFLLAIAALMLLAGTGAAQTGANAETAEFTLYGEVVDSESGRILVGAWVGLPGTEWGSVSDGEGRFRIPDVIPGPFALEVELLGYETLEWTGDISDAAGPLRIELRPQPILLEGLRVVTDRFRARRHALAVSSFAYEAEQLSVASEETTLDFIRHRSFGSVVPCSGARGNFCLYVRGRLVEPVVYVDEAPFLAGLEYLNSLPPWEFHMLEVYGGGRHIRAYTNSYMKRAAERRIMPIALRF